MKKALRTLAKHIGLAVLPDSDFLRSMLNRPRFETWKKQIGSPPVFASREELYEFIVRKVLEDRAIQYLEFGVWKGDSIRAFAGLNTHAESRFVGFDTFTGLPEDWIEFNRSVPRERFDVGGEIPRIEDDRVDFRKGLFQETLPSFLPELEDRLPLVIHNDSDLYSSSLYLLARLDDHIRPGTIILFDEFYSVMHEFRALEDYCQAFQREYEVVGATKNYSQIAIRMA